MKPAITNYLASIGSKGGKIGGKSTSAAKALAARKNGKKGGRPKASAAKRKKGTK